MSANTAIHKAIDTLLSAARRSRQRRLLVLSGEQRWSLERLAELLSRHRFQQSVMIAGDTPPQFDDPVPVGAVVAVQQARQLLGREVDLLVYDAWSGLNPDALAAASGALTGGGLLVLLTPPLPQWPRYNDPDYRRLLTHPYRPDHIAGRFLQHLLHSLYAAQHALLIEQHSLPAQDLAKSTRADSSHNSRWPLPQDDCLGDDQARAVAAIVRVKTGHRRRPLVITSDRGRGKSSALGIASARLMRQGTSLIIITAPRPEAVQPVFEHAARVLGVDPARSSGNQLVYGNTSLRFIAPDELLRHHYKAELLLVDEAAAIPAAILQQLLQRHSRIVFATTVHGYEGSGRGFDLRFTNTLNDMTPQWKAITLQQPIRWAADDPVERWLFDALLLDADIVDADQLAQLGAGRCITEQLDRDRLLDDRASLQQLFGLLVMAHYQTTPGDLRNMLDGPAVSIWVSRFQGKIIAAAVVAEEGGFERDLSMAVWKGQRRLQGHLLPQTLCAHAGLQQAPALRYRRVMRIAVHPAAQRRGIGRALSAAIIEDARRQRCDMVGSSFAATADVLSFWRGVHTVPVRLGVSRDASSGCFSAVVLLSLSPQGDELLDTAAARFNEQFPRELAHIYRDLDIALVAELLVDGNKSVAQVIDHQDWLDIDAFANGYRQFEHCSLALWKLVCAAFAQPSIRRAISPLHSALLIMRILQYQRVSVIAERLQLAGKKQVAMEMQQAINGVRALVVEQPVPQDVR